MTEVDHDLLVLFVRERSEEAFAELVRRHVGLVYAAALRQVRCPELAEEVAQSTFADLARQAASLPSSTVIAAWLYRVARRTAVDVVRSEVRRQTRERIASQDYPMESHDDTWKSLEPLLDDAMDSLDELDRNAVLLRFFENRSLRDVGQALALGEDAAQKRVTRAVERLRRYFTRHGVTVGASALVAGLSANAAAAPTHVVGSIVLSTLKLTQAPSLASIAATAKPAALSVTQKLAATAMLSVALTLPILTFQRIHHTLARQEQQLLAQASQLELIRGAIADLESRIAQLNGAPLANEEPTPALMRWRAWVGRLGREVESLRTLSAVGNNGPTNHMETLGAVWGERVARLKQMMRATPGSQIPELEFLSDKDWLESLHPLTLETDEEVHRAMSSVRSNAELRALAILQTALRGYTRANEGVMPRGIDDLVPYLKSPLQPEILGRYQLVPSKSLVQELQTGDEWLITQKGPVDPEWDLRHSVGLRLGAMADSRVLNRWNSNP